MGKLIKCVMATNLAIVLLQVCVLGFQIDRWNEIVGAVFSIVVSLVGYLPSSFGEKRERWFVGLYAFLLSIDLIFQSVNLILLICFQWVVIQFCIHSNASIDITEYGGVACNEWWHFGYGEINYRDRAMIVSILMGIISLMRLVQIALCLATFRHRSSNPTFFIARDHENPRVHMGSRS